MCLCALNFGIAESFIWLRLFTFARAQHNAMAMGALDWYFDVCTMYISGSLSVYFLSFSLSRSPCSLISQMENIETFPHIAFIVYGNGSAPVAQ